MDVPSLLSESEGITVYPIMPVGVCRHPGVTGWACGEGYSREGGRSRTSPVKWLTCTARIESSNESSVRTWKSQEVSQSISRSEMTGNGVREVRQVHSSGEFPVMGMDAKEPDFCSASSRERGSPSLQTHQGEE